MSMFHSALPPRRFLGVAYRWWARFIAAVVFVGGLVVNGHVPPYETSEVDLPLTLALTAVPFLFIPPVARIFDYGRRFFLDGDYGFGRPNWKLRILGLVGGGAFVLFAIRPFLHPSLPRSYCLILGGFFLLCGAGTFLRSRVQLFAETTDDAGTPSVARLKPGNYVVLNADLQSLPPADHNGWVTLILRSMEGTETSDRFAVHLPQHMLNHAQPGFLSSWQVFISSYGDVVVQAPFSQSALG